MSASKGKQPAGQGQLSTETYSKYLEHSASSLKTALDKYDEYKAEYHELQQTLRSLPSEIEYEAMVPVGPLAFFPGRLINTNEILVSLGDNWFVERSATQAAEIAKRREDFVDAKIAESSAELKELEQRKEILRKNMHSHDLGRELGGDIVNEQGDKIMDIKEELAEDQLPAFGDDEDIVGDVKDIADDNNGTAGDRADDTTDASAADALKQKRDRMIRALSDNNAVDRSLLSASDRAMLERLDQIESDPEDESDSQSEPEDRGRESDEGDAFSDEDRANAARDDDEDDYNEGAQFNRAYQLDRSDDAFALDIVERPPRAALESPLGASPPTPRGILKPMTPISQFREKVAAAQNGNRRKKSVSFSPTAVTYNTASHELLDETNADEDIERVSRLLSQLSTPSKPSCGSAKSPLISVIDKSDSQPADTPAASNSGSQSVFAQRFKPNAAALSGVRSKNAGTSKSAQHESKGSSTKGPTNNAQPLRSAVVEREAVAASVTQDDVDEDMHAREIAQAYNRMRFMRMATGKFDDAANLAEQVLMTTPGVTLIDGPPRPSNDENDEDYDRIELAGGPSGFTAAELNMKPPEVVHAPRRVPNEQHKQKQQQEKDQQQPQQQQQQQQQ
ncbi:uri1, prefoldin-like chaperone, partial [Coemansia erecta]